MKLRWKIKRINRRWFKKKVSFWINLADRYALVYYIFGNKIKYTFYKSIIKLNINLVNYKVWICFSKIRIKNSLISKGIISHFNKVNWDQERSNKQLLSNISIKKKRTFVTH